MTESDASGNLLNPYVFTYDDSFVLPNRHSAHQDFWGYFNNNTCNTLIPTVYIYPAETGLKRFTMFPRTGYAGSQFVINGADRNVDTAAVRAGSLKRITFPMGGYEEFTFRANQFLYDGQNRLGGGLRLERSVRYDGLDHTRDIVKEYSYVKSADPQKTSGVLFNLPVFAYPENFLPYWDQNIVSPTPTGEFDPSSFDYYKYNLVITSGPNYTLSGYDGLNIGYSEIREHQLGNGYTVSRYSTPGRALEDNDVAGAGCQIGEDGYCDGLFKNPIVKNYFSKLICSDGNADLYDSEPIDLTGMQPSSYSYPFAPRTNYEWNRGLLMAQYNYSEQNKKVSEVINEYSLYTPSKKWPKYIWGLRRSRLDNYRLYLSRCVTPTGPWRYEVVGEYSIVANVAKVLSKATTRVFSSNSDESFTTERSFTYNGNQTSATDVLTANNGATDKVHYTYPRDLINTQAFLDTPSNPISFLVYRNNISSPIEVVNSKISSGVEKVTSASVQTYGNFGPKVLPKSAAVLKNSIPLALSAFQPALISGPASSEILTKDSNYEDNVTISKYDGNSNPIEFLTKSKQNTSLIWGYQQRNLIAKVENARSSNVFHENFEDGTGNTVTNRTGRFGFSGSYSKQLTGLDNGTYDLTFWTYNGTKWTYNQIKNVTVANNTYQIALSGQIDDVCFYPSNAMITTYTHDPLVGMTSTTDSKAQTTFYEYDGFARLRNIRDENGNIVKHYDYHQKN